MTTTMLRRVTATVAGLAVVATISAGTVAGTDSASAATARPKGIDVSAVQGTVLWSKVKSQGYAFAYIKATEGSTYRNPDFAAQYNGAYKAGLIRGAYHFANPGGASGATQASYFVKHGGGWSADGRTLPGALDVESVKGSAYCFGKTPKQMAAWITAFSTEYRKLTKRYPVIYSNRSWWNTCVGTAKDFSRTNPLWFAHPGTVGALPGTWKYETFWQNGTVGGLTKSGGATDVDLWNGTLANLKKFARG